MKILYVHDIDETGGGTKVTLDVIRALDKDKHKAILVTPQNERFQATARDLGAETAVIDIKQPSAKHPFSSLRGIWRWVRFLKKNKIDLVHTGDLFVTRTLTWATKLMDIPLVCHVHFPIGNPELRWIFRVAPKTCNFIYCSENLRDTVAPKINELLPSVSHSVIHNSVDSELFRPWVVTSPVLPPNYINIGIIGNFQKRKGHEDLIKAIALLSPVHQNILVHMIGSDFGSERREGVLKRMVKQEGLDRFFVFHGYQHDVKKYLNELDIFVCASHEEAFPMSILEAMAFQLPIASTWVNGIPEAVNDKQNGLLFAPKSPQNMADALKKLIENTEMRNRYGENSRRKVANSFSHEKFKMQISEFYENLRIDK
jgi:glycosyltransferase involved in cell wall biosynthesis